MPDPAPTDESATPGASISDNIFHSPAVVLGSGEQTNQFTVNGVPVGPRFDAAPSSLRPPYIDPARVWGRETELAQIGELATAAHPVSGRIVVVTGPGGIGKTTIAAVIAAQARHAGRTVFWVRWRAGDTSETLTAHMVEMATTLDLPPARVSDAQRAGASLTDLVWDHLDTTPGWVLVFDNLDQPAATTAGEPLAEYRGWVRPSRAGLVLISTRNRDPATWGPAAVPINLAPLNPAEGALMLSADAPHAGTPAQAQTLSTRLGGQPLALRAAGRALSRPTAALRSFTAYQQALAEHTIRVLPELPDQPDAVDPDTARSLVGHTWELSLDQLTTEGQPCARPLLRLLALLAEAPIPRSLLTPSLLTAVATPELGDRQANITTIDTALDGLDRYGLIDNPDPTRTHHVPTVALHPLVRETTTQLLTNSTDPHPWRTALDTALTSHVKQTVAAGRDGWDTARTLAPHLPTLAGLASDNLQTLLPALDALDNLADQLHNAGAYPAALDLRQTVLDTRERILDPEHPDTLTSRNNLAIALAGLGDYQRAAELHQQTLDTRERVHGPEHPNTLQSRNNLAAALDRLGDYQQAAELHQQTLDTRERVHGPEHLDTLGSRNNLAAALHGLGDYQQAAELHQQTLDTLERVHGPEHPDTLTSRNNLANALHGLGNYQRAADLCQQTLDTRERILGPEHPNTLTSRNNLANALVGLGNYQRAADLCQQTLDTLERVHGPEHPDTLTSRNNLAIALDRLGNYQQAAELHQQTLDTYERILGPEHPNTLQSRNNLANALAGLGDYQRAADLCQQTLDTLERVHGPEHPDTLTSRNNLAVVLSVIEEKQQTRGWWRRRTSRRRLSR